MATNGAPTGAVVPEPAAASTFQPLRDPGYDSAALSDGIRRLRSEYEGWKREVLQVTTLALLQEIGIYEYRHRLQDAAGYKARLDDLQGRIRALAKTDAGAVKRGTGWAINGSAAEGVRMVKDLSKLMLRAYNNEADDAVSRLKPYALDAAIKRLEKSRETISRLGMSLKIAITDEYHRLRVEELELTADFLQKEEEERERIRAERERMRDEEKAQREIAREQERLEKERTHYATALAAMRANGDLKGMETVEAKIREIESAIEGVERRAANTRAGYVYVISNVGSFGERMVKIGLTRRLDPLERVHELGDASVPFRFDVHAIIFSDDAVGLEGKLHGIFERQRVNLVNARREFFHASPSQVKDALMQLDAHLLSFTEAPEAVEWRQSVSIRGATAEQVPS